MECGGGERGRSGGTPTTRASSHAATGPLPRHHERCVGEVGHLGPSHDLTSETGSVYGWAGVEVSSDPKCLGGGRTTFCVSEREREREKTRNEQSGILFEQ